jgi:predicted Ser/Thr protein kinase/tetratricopeptide (TPR) repeat protein
MISCPDDGTLAAYLARALDDAEAAGVEEHLAGCEGCRATAMDAADGAQVADADQVEQGAPQGAKIGRYVVLRVLGTGGFGVVYAAFDPQLDRTVALKVLHARDIDAAARRGLLSEAQAMARVSSRNVVAVYAVEEAGEALAIAMELIDGESLREWLSTKKRDWRAVVEVFVEAAHGLDAAHASGIVHRDFKPANVLVGRDGRIAVSDFGLARRRDRDADVGAGGTPGYMAPEQHGGGKDGRTVGPASDQFAFAVALYEGLFREHPFEGASPRETAQAIVSGRRRALSATRVPSWLRRAIDRGLSHDPAKRFPSMMAFAEAIAPARRQVLRRSLLAAAVAASLGLLSLARIDQRTAMCREGPVRAAEVWNDAMRDRTRSSWAGSGTPLLNETFEGAARALDAYMTKWSAAYTDACEATRLRRVQSEEALQARIACLESARSEARAYVASLSTGEAAVVANAVSAATELPDLDACEDARGLLAEAPVPRGAAERIEAIRSRLAEARVARATGDRARARTLAQDALMGARSTNYAPLVAEALLNEARGLAIEGDREASRASLEEAIAAAARGRSARTEAEAWVDLAYVVGVLSGRHETGLALRIGAQASMARVSHAEALEGKLAGVSGMMHMSDAKWEDAAREGREAMRLFAEAYGPDAPQLGPELYRVAEALWEGGHKDEAERTAAAARARIAAAFGPHHATLALPLTLLAQAACDRRDWSSCGRLADEAMSTRMATPVGESEPTFLPILLVQARASAGLGDFGLAHDALAKARSIAVSRFGPNDAWVGLVEATTADVLLDSGAAAEALPIAQDAVRLLDAARGPDHPDAARAHETLARAERATPAPK